MAQRTIRFLLVPLGVTETDRECPECFRSVHLVTFAMETPDDRHQTFPTVHSFDLCVEHGALT